MKNEIAFFMISHLQVTKVSNTNNMRSCSCRYCTVLGRFFLKIIGVLHIILLYTTLTDRYTLCCVPKDQSGILKLKFTNQICARILHSEKKLKNLFFKIDENDGCPIAQMIVTQPTTINKANIRKKNQIYSVWCKNKVLLPYCLAQ